MNPYSIREIPTSTILYRTSTKSFQNASLPHGISASPRLHSWTKPPREPSHRGPDPQSWSNRALVCPTSHHLYIYKTNKSPNINSHSQYRYLPSMALICLGFGITNYIRSHPATTSAGRDNQLTPQQLQLLESYGNRNTLDDVERAMEIYEVPK